jgi:hypothetical protein
MQAHVERAATGVAGLVVAVVVAEGRCLAKILPVCVWERNKEGC